MFKFHFLFNLVKLTSNLFVLLNMFLGHLNSAQINEHTIYILYLSYVLISFAMLISLCYNVSGGSSKHIHSIVSFRHSTLNHIGSNYFSIFVSNGRDGVQ